MLTSLKRAALLLLIAFTPCAAPAANITWDAGGGGDLTWSNFLNFSDDADPTGDTVTFVDSPAAVAAGTVTNIVNGNNSVIQLRYFNNSGTGNNQTTQINDSVTLTASGGFQVGQDPTPVGNGPFIPTHVTIKNQPSAVTGGTLTVNAPAGDFVVDPGSKWFTPAYTTTLDMSGLSNLNATVNEFFVGRVSGGTKLARLANTNVITADEIGVGIGAWNQTAQMRLGQTNTLNTDLLNVSGNISGTRAQSSTITLNFDTGLSSPTVVIRAKNGTGRAAFRAGGTGHTSGAVNATLNLTGGTVDALFSTVQLGIGDTAGTNQARSGNGTIIFDAGTIDAQTITMSSANLVALPTTSGTITINGTGTLIADTINMTERASGRAGNTTARMNQNSSGMLRATTIQRGLALGTGTSTVNFNFNGGTLGHKAGLDGSVAANVPINILTSGTHNFVADAGRTFTINSNVVGAGSGAVNKIGDGTVLMLGTNTYSADTNVSAGILGGTGSATSDFTVAAGATLSPGASAGTLLTNDLDMQANSTLYIELGGTTAGTEYDQVLAAGDVTIGGDLVVTFIDGFGPSMDDVFTIVSAPSITGTFSSVTFLGADGYFDVIYTGTQIQLANFQVPEPSTLSLLGLGALVIARRRRRKVS